MADKKVYPNSNIPIRKASEFLPDVFKTEANEKFLDGVLNPLIQPGATDKLSGYIGRRYGKTFNSKDVYLDSDDTLRSRYQLEPGVTIEKDRNIENFYDYLDLKNILNYFGNYNERDDVINKQEHYSWNPPIDWDKFTNYREYFWAPQGPPSVPVYGQNSAITSTYKVTTSINSWIFTPDGATNNPNLKLYRGQTYRFEVNSPLEGFVIRTNYDTGSLLYNPQLSYFVGDYAIFDDKLWRAKVDITPADGSTISVDSQDWELVDDNAVLGSLTYGNGITNNGAKRGVVEFTVPLDSPDILYYQSDVNPNRLGQFIIGDIQDATFIDPAKEIVGKKDYTSANGITLTNGLVIEFRGQVAEEKYSKGSFLVEGVGKEISLIDFTDLIPPSVTSTTPEILFDNEGFDSQPYDDATQFPGSKDYITINRTSKDLNPWSRYNRWFHRTVLEYAHKLRGTDFDASEETRAKRPIIEFHPNIQLFNHGGVAKQTVDYIDDFTTDIFSKIEGSTGYSVDGEFLFEGARVLVTADTDNLANNKIYEVKFIIHNGRKQINLRETDDTFSNANECLLVRRGVVNAGLMFHFNGTKWISSQPKTSVNQYPLFDMYDEEGYSYSDETVYPVSTFKGTPIFSYAVGNGRTDTELGFKLKYQNINNVGDITFHWNLDSDTFAYTQLQSTISVSIREGYLKIENKYDNGWTKTENRYLQPIINTLTVTQDDVTSLDWSNTIDWNTVTDNLELCFYRNGIKIKDSYTRTLSTFVFDNTVFSAGDVVTIKIVDNVKPGTGYYEFPVGLQNNPLNETVTEFTLGQATDHLLTALEFNSEFTGNVPGVSNLRDLSNFQQHTKRFMKHSGVAAASVTLLNDKNYNLIKSIQYAKKAYSIFKDNFIKKASEIEFEDSPANFVDNIIEELTRTKSVASPFADTDVIGSGAFTSIDYEVDDPGITTFALNNSFDTAVLSRKAVYVYINDRQLLLDSEYTIDSTFAFVRISKELIRGDKIQIREYVSTSFSYVPPTPTSLGIYKKYTPKKFLDDTYREPRDVIQGHDGSITVAYGDFRDDLLLELEYRIYNNIKENYDENVFDIDSIIGSYYYRTDFEKSQIDDIINQEFLKWVADTNMGYTLNEYFKENEPFTYTYNQMASHDGSESLPGWWRGVYKYYYDTDRPHSHPWECLGFTEKPTWWDEEYGEAPYTSGNLILWEDIRDGIIRQGTRAGTYERYARTSILKHLPSDADGELVDPLTSGLATNFVLFNNQGSFKLGDLSPVEYAWRASSEYPFAVTIAMCLLKPFEFIISNFDRSQSTRNILNQIIDKTTKTFITPAELILPVAGEKQTSGLGNYISSYIKSRGLSIADAQEDLNHINVRLSSRLSGFVDQDQQRYAVDSKNPKSSSSNSFIPAENFDIIFDVSSPITTITYSGIIFEKTANGWTASGYDDVKPYFEYFEAVPNQKDPVISVGGLSESFSLWEPNKLYANGTIVENKGTYYRSKESHTSSQDFDEKYWTKLPALPVVGAVTTQRRRNFNTTVIKRLSYGEQFQSIQQVADFLLGHQEYLKASGLVFDNYDGTTQTVQDWTTALKEFMFWTQHNWAQGSLLTVSPGAQRLTVQVAVGVADNLLDGFYEYNILGSNGSPLDTKNINVDRKFQEVTVTTTDTTDGIYYLKINLVLKEHVAIFNDRTVFNDVIFDKPSGYRQERIRTQGFRTVDWDGDYTSPGFIFDNVNIAVWQPFRNYNLGDIVKYRSNNYTSLISHTSEQEFNPNNWTILDSDPIKQLVPNFDYRINQIEDYFNVDSSGLGKSQRDLARHTVGYQTREYLESIAEDPVTQFQIYQGFIREKGSKNPISKIFNKTTNNANGVQLDEQWAFKVGTLGGEAQSYNIELSLDTSNFKVNPQPVLITPESGNFLDRYYRVNQSNFDYAPVPYTDDINPVSENVKPTQTAGYVKLGQTEYVIKHFSDISTELDVNLVRNNEHIWITFSGPTWTVKRINVAFELPIVSVVSENTTVTIDFGKRHNFLVDEYVGIKNIENVSGFHQITSVTNNTITYELEQKAPTAEFEVSTAVYPIYFTDVRYNSYNDLTEEEIALLQNKSKLWIDHNGELKWEVVEKNKVYDSKQITNYGLSDPTRVGEKVVYNPALKQVIASASATPRVMVYLETAQGLSVKQILQPPDAFIDGNINSFGLEIAISPDSKWLAVGSPNATGISSNYRGEYNPYIAYGPGQIVLYAGRLWKTKVDVEPDGSTINVYSEDWEQVKTIEAVDFGSNDGETQMGSVTLYEWTLNQWNYKTTILSPRLEAYEHFGQAIAIGKTETGYTMAVSAPGSLHAKGRVWLYHYTEATGWETIENTNYVGEYNPGEIFFEGQITNDILTVNLLGDSTPITGKLKSGASVTGEGVLEGTYILEQLDWPVSDDGTIHTEKGGIGTYRVSKNHTSPTASVRMESNYFYPSGSVVTYGGKFWQAQYDTYGDGSTLSIDSNEWSQLDAVATQASLPQSLALDDDGSSLFTGLLTDGQVNELVMNGHKFGSSLSMSYDGSVLVVGAPDADNQFFPNYKGVWRPDYEYIQGDVVKYQNAYHRLSNIGPSQVPQDSTIRSYNEDPSNGYPWVDAGDSSANITGKVYFYRKDANGNYNLVQTVAADNLDDFNDLNQSHPDKIAAGDKFGYAVAVDYSGNNIVVSSPQADINYQNQGSAYIFEYKNDSSVYEYRIIQKLESFDRFPNEFFGQSISISPNTSIIAIGANNSPYVQPTIYDSSQTTFDEQRTTFKNFDGFTGSVYVFEKKEHTYYLTEKLDADLSLNESFGTSVSCDENIVVVGSPDFIEPVSVGNEIVFSGNKLGQVRLFTKPQDVSPLTVIASQPKHIDLEQIKRIALFEKGDDVKIQDLEFFDPAKLKILNTAEREITYKVPFDPAVYSVGNDQVVVDNDISWNNGKQVGQLWWNIANAKWIDYEQGDIAYRSSNWGAQAVGSSIDVYEWVESKVLPSEWAALSDTTEGLNLGISGQPLYPDDTVYAVKEVFDQNTNEPTETRYSYWVRNKTTVPANVVGRTISASTVISLISSPGTVGNSIVALIDTNKFLFYNYRNIVSSDETVLNIEYYSDKDRKNAVHNEYQLLTEGIADSLPSEKLETKWLDSLIGYDSVGNRVPDTKLPVKQRYGINFRPRQSMFVDKRKILQILVGNINTVLKKEAFADTINYSTLNSVDPAPSELLKLYDTKVSFYSDLENVGTIRVKQATLTVNIIDSEINSITVEDPGYGYKVAPNVEFEGDGSGAVATTTIDSQGRISSVNVISSGKKYSYAVAKVRNFSVLVENDTTANNYWSVYAWDNERNIFFRSRSQAFDTTRYWSKVDWWKEGYGETSRVVKEILSVYQEPTVNLQPGDLLRINEYGAGGWAVFERQEGEPNGILLSNYVLVGRERGTIQLSDDLWNTQISGIGFDIVDSFDSGLYDKEVAIELRNILKAIKEEVFVGDYDNEWNKLFFASIRYVFQEQTYVDWAFKTSFINAIHNVGAFKTTPTYKNDSLTAYLDYINEIKPYRTTVKEFVSKYDQLETNYTSTTDFDLPPIYSVQEGKIINVDENNSIIDTYPYTQWRDNKGFGITAISISNAGAGYTSVPNIIIEGNGSGAKATAYISNGKVSGIIINEQGSGYTKTPIVRIVGGNGSNANNARAVAILGNSKIRSNNISIKFDRLSKQGRFTEFDFTQTFTSSGASASFELLYPSTVDKTKISILKDGQIVLDSEYTVSLYRQKVDQENVLRCRIIFKETPTVGSVIKITYSKNDEILDSVNRINKYYTPGVGMPGKELHQLMTGIDFGGVLVQGTTFDVTGGWDALPWFTDSWDSVEAAADYYVVCDGSTTFITLPYAPAEGQQINIYLKRAGVERLPTIDNLQYSEAIAEPPTQRIDDPYFGSGSPAIPAVPGVPADAEYNNGALIAENNGTVFDRALTVNGLKLVVAGAVGGQLAVPDEWAKKTARTFELITDPNGAGINTTHQRNFIKTLRGDAGTYHAGIPTVQRVGYGGGSTYTPNWLEDAGIASYAGLQAFNDSVAQKDMVWYRNINGNNPPTQRRDIEEIFEHVFHTVHAFGIPGAVPGSIDAVEMNPDIRIGNEPSFDWQNTALHLAMKEAIDAGLYDPSGYAPDWNTDPEKAAVAYTEYTYLVNWSMWDMSVYWDGGSLSPEWDDSLKTPAGMLANNPLGYALFNTYFAPVLSKPDFATIESIFGENDTGVSGYVVDALVGGSPAVPAVGDSSLITNQNAVMPTFIGDGSTKNIEIGEYVQTNDGDILIFRPSSSDGSVTINDPNLVDTNLSGGSLSAVSGAYATASGTSAEEINIDGSAFTTPDNVPAPEENIPGQVLDSLSIKVFQDTGSGAATLNSKVVLSDGSTLTYEIGQNILEKDSAIVYVDGIKQSLGDYAINIADNTIEFNSAPAIDKPIEILSFGIGGVKILDYQQFIADGDTGLFLTQADFDRTANIYVTVNGEQNDAGFIESTGVVDTPGKTLVQFGITPDRNDVIKIIVLGASADLDSTLSSVVRVNQQQIIHDGSTRSYDLDNFVQLTRESALSSIVAELNGTKLRGVDTVYYVYDGVTNKFTVGADPLESAGSVLPQNVKVYVNGERSNYIDDWVYSSTQKELTYVSPLNVGDTIKIENDLRAEYKIVDNNIRIENSVSLTSGDIIDVTWFGEYPSMSIVSDDYTGGKVKYRLPFKPINISYVWVYLNGARLKRDIDYTIDIDRQSIYIKQNTTVDDLVSVVAFGDRTFRLPSAFEINKDMLNITRYNRYSASDDITLEKDLNYYDKTISVTDASSLSEPIVSKNIPGIIIVNNERIEYMVKDGNTLKQLRRGAYGTGIANTHTKGSLVIDAGIDNTISYADEQVRYDFVSDGSSTLIGPLDFVPTKQEDPNWYATTIPSEFGRCDSLEVFVGGTRLRKTSLKVFDESLGSYSPQADRTLEAEFAVDGSTKYIRITNPAPAGTRISIIKRIGNTWYDRGSITATTGVTLLENSTPISTFIAEKSTRLPE